MNRNLAVVWNQAQQHTTNPERKFVEMVTDFLLSKGKWLTKPAGVRELTKYVQERVDKNAKDAEMRAKAEAKEKADAKKAKKAAEAAKTAPAKKPSDVIDLSDMTPDNTMPDAAKKKTEKKPVKNSKKEENEEESDSENGEVPVGNGGTTDKYVWTQTLAEVEVRVPVPALRGKMFDVQIKRKRLRVGVKGKNPIIDAELHAEVDTEESAWTLAEERGVDGKMMTIVLIKREGMSWWNRVCVGDPVINTKKIEPENSKLDDLDPSTRQTVEKMMFDQRQKQLGKPTSKEIEQQKLLKNFMAQHPEMDFSKCKFGGSGAFPGMPT